MNEQNNASQQEFDPNAEMSKLAIYPVKPFRASPENKELSKSVAIGIAGSNLTSMVVVQYYFLDGNSEVTHSGSMYLLGEDFAAWRKSRPEDDFEFNKLVKELPGVQKIAPRKVKRTNKK